ncbi:PREDICTED: transmembrane protein 161B-like isoform X2 [Priapulus caudatus]|nr:PREDICTED: transmembrane protein 161B-like isoform X2 [Priapulus caudatus]XP_014669401.1 PREDICTED: transmembrane protein 161B-like isoform X2 [Priapulus caudatus]
MIMASFLQKLSQYFSLAQTVICYRLVRYMHPTDEELREAAGIPPPSSRSRGKKDARKQNGAAKDNSFTVPRNIQLKLTTAEVTDQDVVHLHFFTEYQWLVDFSSCAVIVYVITELFYWMTPHMAAGEVNLSLIWSLMALLFILRVLWSLTAQYFRGEDGGERAMCIMFAFFCLVSAMVVLVINEDILELGLDEAYALFSQGSNLFLATQGLESSGPASKISIKVILALCSALVGAFLIFPGMRLAQMYHSAQKYCADNFILRLLLHVNFLSPLIVMLLWIKPIGREIFTQVTWGKYGILMSSDGYESFRLWAVVAMVTLRLCLLTLHLQAYLNLAYDRVQLMSKEAGRISSTELQRMVARVFYYLCVVTLHYVVPAILILNVLFLLKTLGDGSWCSSAICEDYSQTEHERAPPSPFAKLPDAIGSSLKDATEQFQVAIVTLKQVFPPLFFRGILSYALWWLCGVNFASQVFGLTYYSYFAEQQ